jgi:hypothetical protein
VLRRGGERFANDVATSLCGRSDLGCRFVCASANYDLVVPAAELLAAFKKSHYFGALLRRLPTLLMDIETDLVFAAQQGLAQEDYKGLPALGLPIVTIAGLLGVLAQDGSPESLRIFSSVLQQLDEHAKENFKEPPVHPSKEIGVGLLEEIANSPEAELLAKELKELPSL